MDTLSTQSAASAKADQTLRVFGQGSLYDYFGDMVIYRNLDPLDERLSNRKKALRSLGMSSTELPRKQDPDYARLAIWFAQEAQELRGGAELRELLFIGDTVYNDGQAFKNMRAAGNLAGSCFIGSEKLDAPVEISTDEQNVFAANRWAALADWLAWARSDLSLNLDERTVVIVDIDKTALGAKGRNDKVIDRSRIEGAYRTMSMLLGQQSDDAAFEQYYAELNQSAYHKVTQDNQDYLAYICLVISTGLISFDEIVQEVRNGRLENFEQFTRWVESRMMINTVGGEVFRQAHDAVITSVRNGDPTPFKRFRRQEFISTVQRMGSAADDTPVDRMLAEEITLTEEVCAVAEWLRERGCLLICLSDKPDEASLPHRHASPDLPPVHKAKTHRVGIDLRGALAAIE